jgi:hypothetical protein
MIVTPAIFVPPLLHSNVVKSCQIESKKQGYDLVIFEKIMDILCKEKRRSIIFPAFVFRNVCVFTRSAFYGVKLIISEMMNQSIKREKQYCRKESSERRVRITPGTIPQ